MSLDHILDMVIAAGTAYAAIRADLAAMKVRIQHLERKVFGGPV